MRPSSRYLYSMIYETPPCKINLSGSSPPFTGGADFFADLPFLTDNNDIRERVLAFAGDLGAKQDAPGEEIRFSTGSSMVYTQTLGAITEPGDTVLIESPYYDPFIASAEFLRLKVKLFNRTGDAEADLARAKKEARGVKVVVLSNPHCPTGQLYTRDELLSFSKLARHVIVDEVFLPLFADGSLSLLGGVRPENILTIGSFSKTVGLGALRLGWLRATPKTLLKFDKIALNLHIDMPSHSIVAGQRAFKNFSDLLAANLRLADENRRSVVEWAKRHPGMLAHDFKNGYFVTMKVPKDYKSGDEFAADFLQKTGAWVRPTRLFGLPKSVRFNVLVPSATWQTLVQELLPD